MNLKEVVQWMLDNKYGLIVNNQFVLQQKLNQELFGTIIVAPPAVTTTVKEPTKTVLTEIQKKSIWNQFIERAAIPHRVKATDGGEYTVRQYNTPAVNKLIQIIGDPEISYDKLVESTKHYYATVAYKALLSNYLLKDIWRDEYMNYKPGQHINDGSSRWET